MRKKKFRRKSLKNFKRSYKFGKRRSRRSSKRINSYRQARGGIRL